MNYHSCIMPKLFRTLFCFFFVCGALSVPSTGQMSLYWQLNENSGTEAGDSSANGNIGTFPQPPFPGGSAPIIWSPGFQASGVHVRGYTYGYSGITASNSNYQILSQGNGSFSIAMWISLGSLDYTTFVSPLVTHDLAGTRGFRLGVNHAQTYSGWERKLKFWSTESGGTVSILSSTSLPLSIWNHVAVTYNGTTAKMYINGALAGQQAGTITNGADTFKLGGGFGGRVFSGTIDHVRVWQEALDIEDIVLAPIADATYNIPQNTGCGAGAFAIPLPDVISANSLPSNCNIVFRQESGPGSGEWMIGHPSPSIPNYLPNPGAASFTSSSANLAVAGDYRFSATAECLEAVQHFNRTVVHSAGDTYINFAMGGVIAGVSDFWTLQYANCSPITGFSNTGDCDTLSTAIMDFRERVQPGTVFQVTFDTQAEMYDPSVCEVFLRFLVPSGCQVWAQGPGWSESNEFVLLDQDAKAGYSYFTLRADPNIGFSVQTAAYQVKILRP